VDKYPFWADLMADQHYMTPCNKELVGRKIPTHQGM
jgi:hypothetical protein